VYSILFPLASFYIQLRLHLVSDPKVAFLDPMDLRFDDDDDFSTTMDTKTLAANDLITEEFAEGSDKSRLPKQRIGRSF
jgi:hypothetical protein